MYQNAGMKTENCPHPLPHFPGIFLICKHTQFGIPPIVSYNLVRLLRINCITNFLFSKERLT